MFDFGSFLLFVLGGLRFRHGLISHYRCGGRSEADEPECHRQWWDRRFARTTVALGLTRRKKALSLVIGERALAFGTKISRRGRL